MITLIQHISALLLTNDCVIVPELGGFITYNTAARYIEEENLFLPPTRTIGFNPILKINDGVLAQSYMDAYHITFAEAIKKIEKEVNEIIQTLHEKGKVEIDDIGELHYDIYGHYIFVPYEHKMNMPDFYGLSSFGLKTLEQLNKTENPVLSVSSPALSSLSPSSDNEKTYNIRINKTLFRTVVAAVVAIILFFSLSTPIENTYIEKENYAQLLPSFLFEQLENKSVAFSPIITPNSFGQQQGQKRTKSTSKQTTKSSKPIITKEIKVAKPVYKYHIIVASQIAPQKATELVKKLQAQGYHDAKVWNNERMTRVILQSFTTREEATQRLSQLRKLEAYKTAWLFAEK